MKITAAILLAPMIMAGQAEAMIVSLKVGPLIKEAQVLIAAKKYKAATAKLNEAEAVKRYPDDETVINEFRKAIKVASSDPTKPHCTSAVTGVTRCDGRTIGVQP